MTAGVQKIAHSDPRIGFLAQAQKLRDGRAQLALAKNLAAIDASNGVEGAAARLQAVEKQWNTNQTLIFNNLLDAAVAGIFLVLVAAVVCLSVFEWVLLLARKKLAQLRESPPVWLPDYVVNEPRRSGFMGIATLALLLVKELSGEAQLERAQRAQSCTCETETHKVRQDRGTRIDSDVYVKSTEERFNGIRRCC
jgi:carbon starvation protein